MIYEFAVEPELIAEWAKTPMACNLFRRSFGIGEPRILSKFPSKWKELARTHAETEWQRLGANASSQEDLGKLETRKKRFEVLLEMLFTTTIDRAQLSYPHGDWLANAEPNAPEFFHAILARHARRSNEHVLVGDATLESGRWNLQKSRAVSREPNELAKAIAPLLARCKRVIFVDPYFRPVDVYVKSFEKFIEVLTKRNGLPPPESIEIRSSARSEKRSDGWTIFRQECGEKFENCIPKGSEVTLLWLKERPEGDKLHNRYILTELGGLTFGTGFDSGKANTMDDVSIMAREQYDFRWRQHTASPAAFDTEQKAVLIGRSIPRASNGSRSRAR